MEIKLHNTLSGTKEIFKPIKTGEVKMYNCGPTVYDYVHIGNLRAYVLADTVRRLFEFHHYKVKQVVNITDVGLLSNNDFDGEDKMTLGLKREGKPITLEAMKELGDFYTEKFKEDMNALNIISPSVLPKASEHISEDIELIKKLEEKGYSYKTSDGIYFDTSKDLDYGRLGGISADNSHARVELNKEKKNFRDFALWKFENKIGFSSPWGVGFPGWHIECSAMSMKYLGETFDIHTGGIDLAPIHHNNEIAQSESISERPLANYWLHNAFVNVSEGKMAKSAGNFLRLRDLTEQGINPMAYRYWLLTSHYRTPVNFSMEALNGAQAALERLGHHLSGPAAGGRGAINLDYQQKFQQFINDDLDTPKALALVWDLLKDEKVSDLDKQATIFDFDRVLGLNLKKLAEPVDLKIPEEVTKLAEEREKARQAKNWQEADDLRQKILQLGYEIKDTEKGYQILAK